MHPTKLGSVRANPVSLGQLLVAGGFITPGTLQHALKAQRWSRRRLGEILVQRHELSDIERRTILKLQEKLTKHTLALKSDGSMNPALQLRLGQLLLASGEISSAQLDSALAEHSRQHRRLGEVLIEQQVITPIRLTHWLQLQKKLIKAAAIAICMMAASGNAAADDNKQSLWKKFISAKFTQEKTSESERVRGQQGSNNLTNLSIQNRDLNELRRSRDGTLTLRFDQQGLNIIKRF
ncbi:hypothetical protein [Zhongshania sp.]|jgi:hypothetical protein|uniref:hypothetical protein n=1 Tax=Zhongshania sp. TaxID=1971902 RepID=UPI0039E38916